MELLEALSAVKTSRRNRPEVLRDVIPEIRSSIDLNKDDDLEFLRVLFEASLPDITAQLSKTALESIFYATQTTGAPLLSSYNEYVSYMKLAQQVLNNKNNNFSRPRNSLAAEVTDSNNPINAAFGILRKSKNLSDNQITAVLEAAFPLATNGLNEETRDSLYGLANDRGVTPIEVANVYIELVDLITTIRFTYNEI